MRKLALAACALLAVAACDNGKGYHDGVHGKTCSHNKAHHNYVMGTNMISKNVHVRSGPSTNHKILDKIAPGERVAFVKCDNADSWCKLKDGTGWVASRYFSKSHK